jgi:hypothetical protein
MSDMSTLTEVLERLQERSIPEFRFSEKGLAAKGDRFYQPRDLEIIKVYRFEGASDPGDLSIVYVFETRDGEYGYSLNAYGVYDDQGQAYDNFIREVPEKDHGEQLLFLL